MADAREPVCDVETTIGVIGGRWKPMIIYLLFDGPLRFSALHRKVPGITQKMLTQQLKDLEAHGIVHRELYPAVPPKVEYSVTELGKTLKPIMQAMCKWAQVYQSSVASTKLPCEPEPVQDGCESGGVGAP